MARSSLKHRSVSKVRRFRYPAAVVESLDPRVMLSVTALFAAGTLRITGDDQDNVITISRTVDRLIGPVSAPSRAGQASRRKATHFQ